MNLDQSKPAASSTEAPAMRRLRLSLSLGPLMLLVAIVAGPIAVAIQTTSGRWKSAERPRLSQVPG
jgi:hypothetical protein